MMDDEILKHLGYPSPELADSWTLALVQRAKEELSQVAAFRAVSMFCDRLPIALDHHRAYSEFLAGSSGVLLIAATLGAQVDRHLRRLQVEDTAYAVVFNAAAGVWLEQETDTYQHSLPYKELGFRFGPGYAGTPLSDNRVIAGLLRADRIGITFLDSGLMVPSKSMVGMVKVGGDRKRSCDNCAARPNCRYRANGQRCYG